jgi:hypothetical protein
MFETARSALARNNLLIIDNIRLMNPGCSIRRAGKLKNLTRFSDRQSQVVDRAKGG